MRISLGHDDHPDNWPTVRDFKLKFLRDLRSAVSVDSCEAALKDVAMIPLYNMPGTLYSLAQLPSLCYSCKVLYRSI